VYVHDLQNGVMTLVSENLAGTMGGNGRSHSPVLSANGRFLAFKSEASDLVATDTNGKTDIFVRDLDAGTTALASINWGGTDSGNGNSGNPPFTPDFALSADGRFVVFESTATDLVAIPTNARGDVFVRDLKLGVTKLVSVNLAGTSGGNGTFAASFPTISGDGRLVAFASGSSDLVANDTNGTGDVFVRDLEAGATTLVSVNQAGTSGNRGSGNPLVAANGRFVAFQSQASDLVATDTNGGQPTPDAQMDVFVRDLETGTTTLVSVNRTGMDSGNSSSFDPKISADGSIVVFRSLASDLVNKDTNGQSDLFVRDLETGTTKLVSVNRKFADSGNSFLAQELFTSVSLNPDGRFVAFRSWASDLVAPDTNRTTDVFVRPVP
jgi:Tol biopolymer transport system component